MYLLCIVFAAMGVYRLWAEMLRPRWLNWALLPGTVVSEMAYIFGCLITGGEVRRARLMGGAGRAGRGKARSSPDVAGPTTEAEPNLRVIGPIVSAFMSVSACGAGIVVAHAAVGGPVISKFAPAGEVFVLGQALQSLPGSWAAFWAQLRAQVDLLQRMAATWTQLDWLDWRVPLFVYLATCLTIRLAPARRSLRATLAAVVVAAGMIAVIGQAWKGFGAVMEDLWRLVMYEWALMLFLLAVTLVIRGAFALTRGLLAGQPSPKRAPS